MYLKTLLLFSLVFCYSQLFSQKNIENYTERHDDLIAIPYAEEWVKNRKGNKVKVSQKHVSIILNFWQEAKDAITKSKVGGYTRFVFSPSGDDYLIEMDAWRFQGIIDSYNSVSKRKQLRKLLNQSDSSQTIEDYSSRYDDLISVKFPKIHGGKNVNVSKDHLQIAIDNWEDVLKAAESSKKYGYRKITFEPEEGNDIEMDAWRFRGLADLCKNVQERRKIKTKIEQFEKQAENTQESEEFVAKQKKEREENRLEREKRLKANEEEHNKDWKNATSKNSEKDGYQEEEIENNEDENEDEDEDEKSKDFVEKQKKEREKRIKDRNKGIKKTKEDFDKQWKEATQRTRNDEDIDNESKKSRVIKNTYSPHLYYRSNLQDLIVIEVERDYVENPNILISEDENQLKISKTHLKTILSDCFNAKTKLEENEGKGSSNSFIYKPSYWKHRPFEIDYGRFFAVVNTYCDNKSKKKELLKRLDKN